MDPGVRCQVMKTNPSGILCSKYEFYLINGYEDSNFNKAYLLHINGVLDSKGMVPGRGS